MTYMTWSDSLSVGVKKIDDEHKNLLKLINKAHEHKEDKKVIDIVDDLIEFVRVHFTTEEGYFDKYGYPDVDEHKLEHANIIEDVLLFRTRLDKGEDIMDEFLKFLKEGLEHHLTVIDHKYIKFFQKVGLK